MRREVTVSQRIVPADKSPDSDPGGSKKGRTEMFCPKKAKRHTRLCVSAKAALAATLEGGETNGKPEN